MHDKITSIEKAAKELLAGRMENACCIIQKEYPFKKYEVFHRTYTLKQKMNQFKADGFIDRYTGDKLINPGILKLFSFYFPNEFPYHPHGKMTEGHIAYWELFPIIDHIYPIAMGGIDEPENWATTSMLNNAVKSNWSLEQLRWELHPAGDFEEWDGLTRLFVEIVENNEELIDDKYIRTWYNASKEILKV